MATLRARLGNQVARARIKTRYPLDPTMYDYNANCGPRQAPTVEMTGKVTISGTGIQANGQPNLRSLSGVHLDGAKNSVLDVYASWPNIVVSDCDLEGPIKVEAGDLGLSAGEDPVFEYLHVHPSAQAQYSLGALTGAVADIQGTLRHSIVEAAYDAVQGISGVRRKVIDTCLITGALHPHVVGLTYEGGVMTPDQEAAELAYASNEQVSAGQFIKGKDTTGATFVWEVIGAGVLGPDATQPPWPTSPKAAFTASGGTATLYPVGGTAHADGVQLITGRALDVMNTRIVLASNSAFFIQTAGNRGSNATPIYSARFTNVYMEAGNNYVGYIQGQGKIPTGYTDAGKNAGGFLRKTDGTWVTNPATGASFPWASLFRDVVIGNREKDGLVPSTDLKNALVGVPQFVPDEEVWMEKNGNLYGLNPAVAGDYDVLLALWEATPADEGGIDWAGNPPVARQDVLEARHTTGLSTLACDSRTYAVRDGLRRLSDGAELIGTQASDAVHDAQGYYIGV